MKFKEITIERNFRISNDDPYLKEKITATIELDGEEAEGSEQRAINWAREEIITNFKTAYPKVYTHLNFDESNVDFINRLNKLNETPPNNYNTIGTWVIQSKSETPIDTTFNLIDEINKCKKPLLLKVYEPMAKTPEEKKAYAKKLKELSIN